MQDSSELKPYDSCPVCVSKSIATWREKKVRDETYNIDRCGACGFAFVNPRPSLDFLMDYYSSVGHGNDVGDGGTDPTLDSVVEQERNFPNSTIDARRLIKTIKSLTGVDRDGSFLDVGCGYGFFSKEAIDAGYQVVPLEMAENEREIARQVTGLNPTSCSYEEFEAAPGSMSVVLMSQILEHALDINLWVKKAHTLLAEDGVVAIALPNFGSIFRLMMQANEPYICPPAHLNFFNASSLSKLLENHGFRVETTHWVTRIPRQTFEKRLSRFGKPILPIASAASSVSSRLIDALHLGMMISVFARKVRS